MVLIALPGMSAQAAPDQDKAWVVAVMQAVADAWNKGVQPPAALFEPSLTIVDNTPPYLFQGRAAIEQWQAAYAASQPSAIAGAQTALRLGAPLSVETNAAHAYIALPADWTTTQNGHSEVARGVVTATLNHSPQGWRIAGWIWTPR
ncbi:hypothetical protein [Sphingomonas sp.]|uniref:hypothetical protein n=1 Tax=Sphingomonas sp. TaxID=28214 RepID=UPI003B3BB498